MKRLLWLALLFSGTVNALCNVDLLTQHPRVIVLRADCGASVVRSISMMANGVEFEKIIPYKPIKTVAYVMLSEPMITTTYSATAVTQTSTGSGTSGVGKSATLSRAAATPLPTSCIYTYSDWGACQPNGTQSRTILSTAPDVCTGTPMLMQSCIYAPPSGEWPYPFSLEFDGKTVIIYNQAELIALKLPSCVSVNGKVVDEGALKFSPCKPGTKL